MMIKIFSIILAFCQALILICPLLFKVPFQINLMPLIALAVLWTNWLLFYGKNGFNVFSVILWILFAIISLGAVLGTGFFVAGSMFDGEKKKAPVVIGEVGSPKAVALVYHPGGSDLPKTVITLLAERLSQNGIKVTLYTANAGLKINPQEVSAVGFASPVYGGAIRPALVNFINKTDLTGVKCFVIITGGNKASETPDIEKVKKLIESKDGIFIGGKKFTASSIKQTGKIEAFAGSIKDKF